MAIYFKFLFHERKKITDSEGIVYSVLIYKALDNPEFFDKETGDFSLKMVKAFINESFFGEYPESIELDLDSINKTKLAEDTGLSRASVMNIISRLKKKKIIRKNTIWCPIALLDEHYINLPNKTSLTGQQLVFYGFLRDRARNYEGTIDTYAYRLADLFHTTKVNVYHLLAELEHKGYLERVEKDKLKVIEKEPFTGKKRKIKQEESPDSP